MNTIPQHPYTVYHSSWRGTLKTTTLLYENDETSKEEIAEKIAELNSALKELRKELKVGERIIANLSHLHLEQEEEQRSKNNKQLIMSKNI